MKVCTRANAHFYRNVAEYSVYGTQLLISGLLVSPVKQASLKGANERRRGKGNKNFTGEVKIIGKDKVGNYIPIKV
jgi:hypothetical protein